MSELTIKQLNSTTISKNVLVLTIRGHTNVMLFFASPLPPCDTLRQLSLPLIENYVTLSQPPPWTSWPFLLYAFS